MKQIGLVSNQDCEKSSRYGLEIAKVIFKYLQLPMKFKTSA